MPWLAATIRRWVDQRPGDRCLGYGVVVPGIVDAATGTVRAAPNVDWVDVPLRDQLTELTGLPGVVAHDVRSAGLAEWRLGSGVGAENLLFLSIGTGIAGAMVVDGRMLDAGGYAGEIGHTRVTAAGDRRCACGQSRLSGDAGLGRRRGPDVRTPIGRFGRAHRSRSSRRPGAKPGTRAPSGPSILPPRL